METKHVAQQVPVADFAVMQKIYMVRGQKVMLDGDLAVLYGYETKRMNEQVKRNEARFPVSFMFQLTSAEVASLRSQFATANLPTKARVLPYAFTEHGVLMLASVLKSETAIKASVHIIEAFVKLREMVLTHKDILLKLEQLEKKQAMQDTSIRQLLQYLKRFTVEKQQERPSIGFKVQ
ncbi:MAG: ORF6N domain-containing protein [Bacteroidota bacterium]